MEYVKIKIKETKILRQHYISIITNNTYLHINTLSPRQNDRHFPEDIFKHIFCNKNVGISFQI